MKKNPHHDPFNMKSFNVSVKNVQNKTTKKQEQNSIWLFLLQTELFNKLQNNLWTCILFMATLSPPCSFCLGLLV